ncbi:MAG: type III secretion system cytoplasmic ring protein SctQ, partial [Thermodesulforhabdaceae bacterium]
MIEMIHEETGTVKGRGELLLNGDGFKIIATRLKGIPRKPADFVRSIPVSAGLLVGETSVSWEDLKSLEVGDIVLVEHDYRVGENRLVLRIPPDQEFWVEKQEESQVVVVGRRDSDMSEKVKEEKEQQEKAELVNVGHVEVELRFEVGRKMITVGELEKIGVGYVFALDTPVDKAVSIYANRQLIGSGELVEIEGRVGVRVLEMRNDSAV